MAVKPVSGDSQLSIIQDTPSLTAHLYATNQTRQASMAVRKLLAVWMNAGLNQQNWKENGMIELCPLTVILSTTRSLEI